MHYIILYLKFAEEFILYQISLFSSNGKSIGQKKNSIYFLDKESQDYRFETTIEYQ